MNVVAIIPAFGRLPLLKYTIERLIKKNGVSHVVVVAWEDAEKKVIQDAGGIFVKCQNNPLGKKWNTGFQFAKTLNPDVCLFVGSSDWISDNWLPTMLPFMNECDLIGKSDYYMADIQVSNEMNSIRACHWVGYGRGNREKEPIGIGRLISARILDKMNWTPFENEKGHNMDYMMFQNVGKLNGTLMLMQSDELLSLSISTNLWSNMHKFEDHWHDLIPKKTHRLNPHQILFHFPELKTLAEDLYHYQK